MPPRSPRSLQRSRCHAAAPACPCSDSGVSFLRLALLSFISDILQSPFGSRRAARVSLARSTAWSSLPFRSRTSS
jgi:hypothetical protein